MFIYELNFITFIINQIQIIMKFKLFITVIYIMLLQKNYSQEYEYKTISTIE